MDSYIRVRILILSDTHDFDYFLQNAEQPFRIGNSPSVDVILHYGDFTEMNGSPEQIERAFKALGSINAELKIAITGNHEASLDKDFFLSQGGDLSEYKKCARIVKDSSSKYGVKLLEEGMYTFTLKSGAKFKLFASPYTPAYGISAFQYEAPLDRFNPSAELNSDSVIQTGTDIVMTHGPPKYVLDCTRENVSAGCEHPSTSDMSCQTETSLLRTYTPRIWH
jgi:hypothetical protein